MSGKPGIFDEEDSAPKPKKAKSSKVEEDSNGHVSIPFEQGTLYVKYAARASEDLHIEGR